MSLVVAPPSVGVAGRVRPFAVYLLMVVLGMAAFLYPFWLPATALPSQAHSGDAPLVAALVGALVIAVVMLEVRRGTMNGATVAILGMLSAVAGLLRLIDLPRFAFQFHPAITAGDAHGKGIRQMPQQQQCSGRVLRQPRDGFGLFKRSPDNRQ